MDTGGVATERDDRSAGALSAGAEVIEVPASEAVADGCWLGHFSIVETGCVRASMQPSAHRTESELDTCGAHIICESSREQHVRDCELAVHWPHGTYPKIGDETNAARSTKQMILVVFTAIDS